MKKFLCTAALACLICTAGCGQSQSNIITDLPSKIPEEVSDIAVFVSGMGCSDPNCTDASHHHDCLPDCGDYAHHHNCSLDCTDASHHHDVIDHEEESHDDIDHEEESHDVIDHEEEHHDDPTSVTTVSFISGMGCSDPNCTDASHHHDCPSDCNDYEHHHNCPLDCTDENHHHNGTNNANGSGQHHTKQHHGNDHH